jgi:hypothetical protein
MPEINVLSHTPVSLRECGINEDWVQRYIADDPSRLGLGLNLILLARERRQPKAGRLDILLADRDSEQNRWYEVEIMLGPTDESHIIRCIEYWDKERKDRPHYEHVAVLVAEDITNRFFKVIQLFNGHIPIVAIKMVASKVENGLVLQFVTVLHPSTQSVEEEEERAAPVVNREWWDKASSKESMQVVDSLFKIIEEWDNRVKAYYSQTRIRPQVGSGNMLPLRIHPRKKFVDVSLDFGDSQKATDWKGKLEGAGLEASNWRPESVSFRLTPEILGRNVGIVREILKEVSSGD